jgi:hypothetical protein
VSTPATKNITVTRGDTFDMYLGIGRNGSRIDLTGATVTGQVRSTEDSPTVMGAFTCVLANQTTDPGGILCTIPKTVTETFTGNGGYDIQILFANGDVKTVVRGTMTMSKDYTHA